MDDPCTTDLSNFGYREIREMITLLDTWMKEGLPSDFEEDEVKVMFNMNSGSVFLTNSEYQTAMMNCDKLESWYNCPDCGFEGFLNDFEDDADKECEGCQDVIKYAKEANK